MTTVAFDGAMIACDSLATCVEDSYASKDTIMKGRKVRTPQGEVLAIAVGILSDYYAAIPLLEQGKLPPLRDESLIIVVQEGKVYTILPIQQKKSSHRRLPTEAFMVDTPEAWGTGHIYADVVLRLRGTAAQAVAASCLIDLYSGGEVHAWDIKTLTKLKVPKKSPKVIY